MSIFVKPTKPPEASRPYRLTSYGLGLLATGMAAAQMVSFEEFVAALGDYGLTGERGAVALAMTLISLEVFSVPFLLRLSLSPLARLFSALFVVLLPCAWTVLAVSGLSSGASAPNAGYFGGFLSMQLSGLFLLLDVVWLTVVGFAFAPMGGGRVFRLKA